MRAAMAKCAEYYLIAAPSMSLSHSFIGKYQAAVFLGKLCVQVADTSRIHAKRGQQGLASTWSSVQKMRLAYC